MTVTVAARRRSILFASCAALMALVASASGLSVAQQALALDLDASQTSVLLVINAYVVTLAALLLPCGAVSVSDRWVASPSSSPALLFLAIMAVLFLILALGLREGQPATSFEEELA